MNYEDALNQAINSINCLRNGQEFLLKELFNGTEWNNYERGFRQGLGRVFKNRVLNGNIENVEYIEKADNNSARYIVRR